MAWWRGGKNRSVGVDARLQRWKDFKSGDGGRTLALVEKVLGCDRRGAIEWLAQSCGVNLDNRPLTPADRREWRRRRVQADRRAADLTQWRESTLHEIRARRNELYVQERQVSMWARWALENDASEADWEFAWALIAQALDAERLDRWVGRIEEMLPADVISLRERMEMRAAG